MTSSAAPVAPAHVCVQFAHAAVEHLARGHGIDVLHIKGAAIDPSLGLSARSGSDADVLVRPSQVAPLLDAMLTHGWRVETDFEHGSPFGHATTLVHPEWGYADLHRHFPGVTLPPEEAFSRLWADRGSRPIAGMPCPVPSADAHAVLLVLNAARPGANSASDVTSLWSDADDARRGRLQVLVEQLEAEVAFAAATGELDRFRGRPDHDLWQVTSQGGGRLAEWRARIKAAPSRREAVRLALRAPLVNVEHLAVELGHPPSRTEVAQAYLQRARRALAEARQAAAARLRKARRQ